MTGHAVQVVMNVQGGEEAWYAYKCGNGILWS